MKSKFLLLLLITFCSLNVTHAQYGNEWIDYSKTYYKFKVGAEGVYKIGYAELNSLGLSSQPGSTFTVYRNGVKIPIYVSTSGVLGTTDYIEFFADKNRGDKEAELYTVPANQPTKDYSIITDTAVYFLVSMSGTHPRVTNQVNAIPSPAPTPAPYFWFESKRNNGATPTNVDLGKNYDNSGSVFYPAGDFDATEGRSYGRTATSGAYNLASNISTRQRYTATDLPAKIKLVISNIKLGSIGKPNLYVGTTKVFDTTYASWKTITINKQVLTSTLGATTTSLPIYDTSGRTSLNYLSVEYPRLFNFSGFTNSKTLMKLDAYTTNTLLTLTNVPSMGTNALIYDLDNNKRYLGQNVTATGVQFMINSGSDGRRIFFTGSNDIATITNFESKVFKNFSTSSNQGDYLIVTHKDYIDEPASTINTYKTYRESPAGGGHIVQVIDAQEAIDQFGYGAIFNPIGVRNFFKNANNTWTTKPKHVFIISKGITYNHYRNFENNYTVYNTNKLVPTFGHPGSDNMLVDFNSDNNPDLAIGRISVYNSADIQQYYNKVIAYENAVRPSTSETIENSLWKKRALFVAGGDYNLQTYSIMPTFNTMMAKYSDTLVGGVKQLVRKGVPNEFNISNSDLIDSVINEGVSRIIFYGHASSSGFEYSLNDPDNFTINPKFPIFYGFGCDVAEIFGTNLSIGERYLKSVNGGSIALIACDNFGWVSSLTPMANATMDQITRLNYGATLGTQFKNTFPNFSSASFGFIHKQCFLLQGDPGLQSFNPNLPDYFLSDSLIKSPFAKLNVADSFFRITAYPYNLGKGTNDSVKVDILHTLPDGSTSLFTTSYINKIKSNDSFTFVLPINPITHIGVNTFTVRINNAETVVESNYNNNTGNISIEVLRGDIVPVYPYEFSIVYTPTVTLKAMSLDVFADSQNYRIQIDTTEHFNSPSLITQDINNTIGGLVTYTPTLTMVDSTVYYWRVGVVDATSSVTKWNYSSFVYLATGSEGWNQSHYFQYMKNPKMDGLVTLENDRPFKFNFNINELLIRNRVYNSSFPSNDDVSFRYRDTIYEKIGCNLNGGNIRFAVFDSLSGNPMFNNSGDYGSMTYCYERNRYAFEYKINNATERKKAADFLALIPNGNYVLVQNLLFDMSPYLWDNNTVTGWYADTLIYGYEASLIGRLKALGFNGIDSFTSKRVFAYFTKKGDTSYPSMTQFTVGDMDLLSTGVDIPSQKTNGSMTSVQIGPASAWTNYLWNPYTKNGDAAYDTSSVQIFGITPTNTKVSLFNGSASSYNLATVNASTYPKLELVWTSKDAVQRSSHDLDYWRIIYTPYPDLSIDPNAHLTNRDTVYQGENVNLKVAYRNISNANMDSVMMNIYAVNSQGVETLLQAKKYKPLTINDTFIASVIVNTTNLPGVQNIKFVANEGMLQKEQFLHNNVGVLPLVVIQDIANADINVAYHNSEISGDLSSNDIDSCTYSNVIASTSNPSTASPTLNSDGTYTFISVIPGVYRFKVSVCKNNQCIQENLQITVLPSVASSSSKPVANTDLSMTKAGVPITINILANDKAIAVGSSIINSNTSVTINNTITSFKSLYDGNVVVNSDGTITYSPVAGFIGIDVIEYTVCDNNAVPNCASAQVFVRVIPSSMVIRPILSDDYNIAEGSAIASGNVLTNDRKGTSSTTLVVTPLSIANEFGNFTLLANGSYTYIPTSYNGTVIYEYTACDTGATPDVCTKGSIVIQSRTVPLDIDLLSFDAVAQDRDALITWSVDDEKEVKLFDIEHSIDGVSFSSIGTQNPIGALKYSMIHATPVLGENYYRLKMINNENKSEYSPIKIVVFQGQHSLSLYPNPTADVLNIKLSYDIYATIQIFSIDGKELFKSAINGKDASINLKHLPSGIYSIKISNSSFEFSDKIIINR